MRKRQILVAAAVLLLILTVIGVTAWKNLTGSVASIPGQDIIFDVPEGSSTTQIGSQLKEQGLVNSSFIFRLLSRSLGYDEKLKAGKYILNTSMTPQEILERLSLGEVYEETIWLTIPEGLRVEEVIALIVEKGVGREETFFALAADPKPLEKDFFFLQNLPPDLEYPLEGYLFPDTYEFQADAGEEQILRKMLSKMADVLIELGYDDGEINGLSVHEAVTLASIVEREAVLDEERPTIAGVFYNRLDINKRLESCATVQYVLGEVKPALSNQDTRTPSPYNTYLHAGLPPGPIAASGWSSLSAVANPESHDYLYFNTRKDGSSGHYFSKTLAEHENNKDKADQNNNS